MSTTTVEVKNQNFIFLLGRNFVEEFFFVVRVDKIRIDIARATTPPSFEGIDRRIT